MDVTNLSISTITWARDAKEENLLRESLAALALLNIPVFVTDGGSGDAFVKFLKSFPQFTVLQPEKKGLLEQVKKSLITAYDAGSENLFYTEPDKLDFFKLKLSAFLSNISFDQQTGIGLASRSDAAFHTFPSFQQTTEAAINACCFEIVNLKVDYTYGPFLLNRKLVPYIKFVNEDIGWGWRPYMFGLAKRLAYKVTAITDDFFCPDEQRPDNQTERLYRMRQLTQNIQGLVLSTAIKLEEQ